MKSKNRIAKASPYVISTKGKFIFGLLLLASLLFLTTGCGCSTPTIKTETNVEGISGSTIVAYAVDNIENGFIAKKAPGSDPYPLYVKDEDTTHSSFNTIKNAAGTGMNDLSERLTQSPSTKENIFLYSLSNYAYTWGTLSEDGKGQRTNPGNTPSTTTQINTQGFIGYLSEGGILTTKDNKTTWAPQSLREGYKVIIEISAFSNVNQTIAVAGEVPTIHYFFTFYVNSNAYDMKGDNAGNLKSDFQNNIADISNVLLYNGVSEINPFQQK